MGRNGVEGVLRNPVPKVRGRGFLKEKVGFRVGVQIVFGVEDPEFSGEGGLCVWTPDRGSIPS